MPSLRRSFAVPPLFLRRRTDKGRSYLQAISPCPAPPFPPGESLQFPIVGLMKYVTDGLYRIGQLALVTARFGQKIVNLAPKDLQLRSECWNTNSLRWVPRRGKSVIKWGHRMVLEAIWGGFLDDRCHTSDVGSQIVVFLTVSYFIVILLFRRIWQSFHLTFCDSNSCDSWFLEGYVFSLFLYILLIIN